jgi:hypothetical protein
MSATIDFRHAVVAPGRSDEGVTHPADLFRTGNFSDESAAQKRVEIEREIGLQLSGPF